MTRLLVIDDDEISREVLSVLAADAGYAVTCADSGDAALAMLAEVDPPCPSLILVDMRMTGTTGYDLAVRLRKLCGPAPRLIAMSSQEASGLGFDGFLRKPFTIRALERYLEGAPPAPAAQMSGRSEFAVLDEAMHEALRAAMCAADLRKLYALCLDDNARRIARMREACLHGRSREWIDEAHAICGSCGFVGALRLGHLAARMEKEGIPPEGCAGAESDVLTMFLAASGDLRRILEMHA